MKKSNHVLTIEEALEVFDKARHVSIRPKGCTLVLGFLPYHRAEGRRKKGETFAQMLCRVASRRWRSTIRRQIYERLPFGIRARRAVLRTAAKQKLERSAVDVKRA